MLPRWQIPGARGTNSRHRYSCRSIDRRLFWSRECRSFQPSGCLFSVPIKVRCHPCAEARTDSRLEIAVRRAWARWAQRYKNEDTGTYRRFNGNRRIPVLVEVSLPACGRNLQPGTFYGLGCPWSRLFGVRQLVGELFPKRRTSWVCAPDGIDGHLWTSAHLGNLPSEGACAGYNQRIRWEEMFQTWETCTKYTASQRNRPQKRKRPAGVNDQAQPWKSTRSMRGRRGCTRQRSPLAWRRRFRSFNLFARVASL